MKNNTGLSTKNLLIWFLKEEWRFHSGLIGNKRFLFFPIAILAIAIGIGFGITYTDITETSMWFALAAFVTLFGIQTGVVGFEAEDAMENLIGEQSRIIFSSRTLPITDKRLISVFLLKDIIYYSALFLIPILIGSMVGVGISPMDSISITPLLFGVGYITSVLFFIFGVSIGFLVTTFNKNIMQTKWTYITGIAVYAVAEFFFDIVFQPVYDATEIPAYILIPLLTSILTVLFVRVGLRNFKDNTTQNKTDTYTNIFEKYADLIGDDDLQTLLITKTYTDIHRTAGGLFKILFTTGVLVFAVIAMIYFLGENYVLSPHSGFLFGGLISLIAYPVYNVVFRYDSIDDYTYLPILKKAVYKSKMSVFFILAIPLSTAYYLPTVVWLYDTNIEIIQGLLVMYALIVYQLGLLRIIVKDKPSEFLFDGLLFSYFAISVFVILFPVIVIGMFGSLLIPSVINAVLVLALISSLLGFYMYAKPDTFANRGIA